MGTVREGSLPGGLPYLAVGTGPPAVVFPGLTPDNHPPTGVARSAQLRPVTPLTGHFTVYVINRRPGLLPGTGIGDLAGDYARAIGDAFTPPVPVVGISTGGSVALRFAADHPELVDRLVLVAAACRLSEQGRLAQRRLAELMAAGRPRRAWASTGRALATSPAGGRLMAAALWLAGGGSMAPTDPSDLLLTVAAEDAFDLCDRLPEVTAPTLVIGGGRDGYYEPDLFRRTAAGVRYGWLRLYHRQGHAGVVNSAAAGRDTRTFLTHPIGRRAPIPAVAA